MRIEPETRTTECQIVCCYDGSETGRHALLTAASTLGERRAVVVTVWHSSWLSIAAAPYALLPGDTMEKIDEAAKNNAATVARQGAALIPGAWARALASTGSTWRTVLDFADECDAELIVVGSRGLSQVKSVVLGSVSHGLVNNSRRPVMVVPPERS
jgi:nucleotide-binding universal stress UspA family protein